MVNIRFPNESATTLQRIGARVQEPAQVPIHVIFDLDN